MSPEGTEDRRRWVLQEIARDAERDVYRFEGQPFTGKTVAEYMGCQAAAIKRLAEIVESLLPVLDRCGFCQEGVGYCTRTGGPNPCEGEDAAAAADAEIQQAPTIHVGGAR